MFKKLIVLVSFCMLFLFSNVYAEQNDIPFQEDYEAIDRAAKSCFLVDVIGLDGSPIATGSGFVAFDEHVFITNYHVIEDSISINIYSDQYQNVHTLTDVIIADKEKDIAILAFPEGNEYEALSLAPEHKILRGQPVIAIGSPEGILNTVSSGNISSILTNSDGSHEIQFTAPISHGSSGGALFNNQGNIIALVFAIHITGENMNYAVPIEYVVDLYESSNKTSTPLAKYNFPDHYITPPETVTATFDDNSKTKITWSVVDNAVDYRVYRVDETGNEKLIATRTVSQGKDTGSAWDAKPLYGQTVSYYVVARSKKASSEKSDYATIVIPPKPTPKPTKEPTLKPTPKPTPVPTATPTLPEGIKDNYKPGASGSDIRIIKERMQELGYYTKGASLGSSYNQTMEERVKLFQSENHLTVTGILDHKTLLVLFSNNAKSTKNLNATPKPTTKPTTKPTPKKTSEPKVTLVIPNGAYGEWDYVSGDGFKFRLQVQNTSATRTITAYELYIYTEDVWGNRLIPEDKVYVLSVEAKVAPGKKQYSSYITMADAKKIDKVYAAINKVKYSDGTIENVRYHDYSYWEID